jgi:small subunit ribosomal protein S6
MPLYEHVFMSRQDISQAQVDALQKEFAEIITQGGGTIGKVEYWGVKSLTYKIKKNRKAHFTLMNIDAPAAAVGEMERRMGISTDVLRFLTIRVDAHETEPSVMMRKSDRDDRGERGERGGFRGDRGPRGGGGGRFGDRDRGDRGGDRGDRPPREGGFRRDRDGDAPRRPRDPAAPGASTGE